MRNALHRAVLRRLLLRLSVLTAFALAFFTVLAPGAWLSASLGGLDAMLGRMLLGALAATLLVLPAAIVLLGGKRPRARVTASRAAASSF